MRISHHALRSYSHQVDFCMRNGVSGPTQGTRSTNVLDHELATTQVLGQSTDTSSWTRRNRYGRVLQPHALIVAPGGVAYKYGVKIHDIGSPYDSPVCTHGRTASRTQCNGTVHGRDGTAKAVPPGHISLFVHGRWRIHVVRTADAR